MGLLGLGLKTGGASTTTGFSTGIGLKSVFVLPVSALPETSISE